MRNLDDRGLQASAQDGSDSRPGCPCLGVRYRRRAGVSRACPTGCVLQSAHHTTCTLVDRRDRQSAVLHPTESVRWFVWSCMPSRLIDFITSYDMARRRCHAVSYARPSDEGFRFSGRLQSAMSSLERFEHDPKQFIEPPAAPWRLSHPAGGVRCSHCLRPGVAGGMWRR